MRPVVYRVAKSPRTAAGRNPESIARVRRAWRGHARPSGAAAASALGGHPVGAHAHLDLERRVHIVGAAHGVAQQGHALLDLGLGALEDELVVHLEDEPRAQLAPGEFAARPPGAR